MFSQSPRQFSSGQDPWFKIGTVDIGTTGVFALAVLFGMLVSVAEGSAGPVFSNLLYTSDHVVHGHIWRVATWWFVSADVLKSIIHAAIIFFIGGQIEAVLGRVRMAKYMIALVLLFPAVALGLYAIGLSEIPLLTAGRIANALFYSFILLRPGVRPMFGIPIWVVGVVFFFVDFLNSTKDRGGTMVLFLLVTVGLGFLLAKVFGLANDIPWIPDLRRAGVSSPSGQTPFSGNSTRGAPRTSRSSRRRSSRKGGPVRPPVVGVDSSFEDMGIDEILDQISAFGVESLNSAQRKKLDAYSKGKKKDK